MRYPNARWGQRAPSDRDAVTEEGQTPKKTVLIKDLIGTEPVKIDQRSLNADGSLKYPEQQKTPRITTLRRVYLEKQKGRTWLYWEWDPIPETPHCNYSGFVLDSDHAPHYALEVLS